MSYGNYPDHNKIKKILVIKLRHLGDVLLTTPVFSALKKGIPDAQIDAYINLESKPLLENNPNLTKIFTYDRSIKKKSFCKKIYYEWQLLRKIKKQKYDLVMNLTEGDRGSIAARASKACYRIGMETKRKSLYTHIVKNCANRHTVEKNLDAVRRIGIFPEEEEKKLYFSIPKYECAHLLQQVPCNDFLLIHPTSRWRFKCWPVAKVRELIRMLLNQKRNVVVTSGTDPLEKQMIDHIIKGLRSEHLFNLSGKITLGGLGFLIKHTKGLVCVDSLPFHIASTFKTPVVALFGPTSEITWGPWKNPNAKIITKNMSCRPCFQDGCGGSKVSDCLYSIKVQEVLNALAEIGALKKESLLKA